jgi:hypothetical protein
MFSEGEIKSFYLHISTKKGIAELRQDHQVVARIPISDPDLIQVAKELLIRYLRAAIPWRGLPEKIEYQGLIKIKLWKQILRILDDSTTKIHDKKGDIDSKTTDPMGIVELAKTLGLRPYSLVGGAPFVKADCPGTHHWIKINTQNGTWFCGYCHRKGDSEELKHFVKERKGV